MPRFLERHFLFYSVIILLLLAALAGVLMLRVAHQNETAQKAVQNPSPGTPAAEAAAPEQLQLGSWPDLANKRFFASVESKLQESGTTFIEADLSALRLRVYQGNKVALEVPIKTIGREGSWWQTPVGLYQVQSKEENHFSSFGHVYMPWSLNFQGNFFIHGWPYHPDGTDVSSQYSGGCIRLDTNDAEQVYRLVDTGTPVLVFEDAGANDTFAYAEHQNAAFAAPQYLIADAKNGDVLAASDVTSSVQMGSAVHLLAALVGVEYINIEHAVAVPATVAASARLAPGNDVSVYDLLHLALAENNEDALATIAHELGTKRFVTLMNNKAAAIGMQNTHITSFQANDPGNVTTAEDLFVLGSYLSQNRSFILKLTHESTADSVYGAPAWNDLQFDKTLSSLAGFNGGVRSGDGALSLVTIKTNGVERPVVMVAANATDAGSVLAAMRAWIQQTYE
jgi:lipoprotein-anchoring transpeptidase ErfK/SrfK